TGEALEYANHRAIDLEHPAFERERNDLSVLDRRPCDIALELVDSNPARNSDNIQPKPDVLGPGPADLVGDDSLENQVDRAREQPHDQESDKCRNQERDE